jgi:hypothetical protein
LPPCTVRDNCVGRPRESLPVKTRTYHTPGLFSRSVATSGIYPDLGWSLGMTAGRLTPLASEQVYSMRRPLSRAMTSRWISGAFEDRVDLRIPVPPLDRVIACSRTRRGSGWPARWPTRRPRRPSTSTSNPRRCDNRRCGRARRRATRADERRRSPSPYRRA